MTSGLADTHVGPPLPVRSSVAPAAGLRSTVLPRIERGAGAARLVLEGKPRYQPLRHLGSGGQAEVTLARDHDIDRPVAVKRLLPDRSDDAAVLRFAEEIRTVGQLEHPNIVPIHDVGVDEKGQYFFIMKYVEGETLESIIARLREGDEGYRRRYTPEYRLQICGEILRGVEHAHELGILHRDLKPANIMVGSLGEVVIMDWGLSKRIGGEEPARPAATHSASGDERARLFETQAGALLGTPAYMAPEQAAGHVDAIDARSDVYSLALMFYEFLSLKHPRSHCTSVAEMVAATIDEPIDFATLLADFGRGGAQATLAHFVRRGLERDPADRYPSVKAMRERLELVRDGRAPIQCHVTFTQRVLDGAARSANRHPWILGGVLGAIGLGLVGGVAALVIALVR
ncbi:MAG TPA: serine/threonine-protein kinase [Polyangia bacterium]